MDCTLNTEENALDEVSMQIILHAGNARSDVEEALRAIKEGDFSKSKNCIALAKENIKKAHGVQTQIIQHEAQGHSYGPSILFNHAQDTLMTIKSEITIAQQIIDLFEIYDEKIKNLIESQS